MNRRTFLAAALAPSGPVEIPADLRTPFKVNHLVLSASGKPGAFDEKAVDCPFVCHHAGRFYMTFVAFDGTGYQTGLASSTNLLEWRPEGLILGRDPKSEFFRYNVALNWIVRENDVFSKGELKKFRGKFLGVYHAYPNAGYEQGPAVIGLCWSTDLRKWQLDAPILRAEDGAEWERGGLYKPCLVHENDTFYLFYNAKTADKRWREQTGVATSRDLKTWTRHTGNPLLHNGQADSPDERFASDPCVLKYGKQWAMFYFGLDRKGVARDLLAVGPDLLHFEKCAGVSIDVGAPGTVDEKYAHKPSIVAHNGVLHHFYCAVSKDNTRGISVALSREPRVG